jgi:hypothetical protein
MKPYSIIIAAACSLLWAGCRTKTLYTPTESSKVEHVGSSLSDSVRLYDSVFLKVKGDTVFFERYHERIRNRAIHDSIHIRDSIRVPYPVINERKTSRPYRWWEKSLMAFGCMSIAYIAFKVAR